MGDNLPTLAELNKVTNDDEKLGVQNLIQDAQAGVDKAEKAEEFFQPHLPGATEKTHEAQDRLRSAKNKLWMMDSDQRVRAKQDPTIRGYMYIGHEGEVAPEATPDLKPLTPIAAAEEEVPQKEKSALEGLPLERQMEVIAELKNRAKVAQDGLKNLPSDDLYSGGTADAEKLKAKYLQDIAAYEQVREADEGLNRMIEASMKGANLQGSY